MHLEENSDVRDNLPGILSIPDILEGYTKKAKPWLLFTQAIAQDCVYKELWGMRQCLSIEKKKRPISTYYKKSILQAQSLFPISQPTVCAGIHDGSFANYNQRHKTVK